MRKRYRHYEPEQVFIDHLVALGWKPSEIGKIGGDWMYFYVELPLRDGHRYAVRSLRSLVQIEPRRVILADGRILRVQGMHPATRIDVWRHARDMLNQPVADGD